MLMPLQHYGGYAVLKLGEILFERYKIVRKLGHGLL